MRWAPRGELLLLGVAAVAAGLRWFRIDAQSLWYDEGISAHQLTRSFPEIVRAAELDTHPPLYYAALKAWAKRVRQQEWRDAFVFFKHDDKGHGPALARRFVDLGR